MIQRNSSLIGFSDFFIIWLGQLISLLGTSTTRFALTIWAYQETQSATALTLVAFFSFAPLVIFSPIAGALVDRWNRKLVLMISDLAAGLSTNFLLIMFVTNNLHLWHIFVAGAIASIFESFQFPAFSAATTIMLDKAEYGRASGMLSMAESAAQVIAPLLGGFLLPLINLNGILIMDIITFTIAVITIAVIHLPQPMAIDSGKDLTFWQSTLYGFRYILERSSLFGMQLVFFIFNFLGAFGIILLPAYVLARSHSNELVLGTVQSAGGIGALVGGLIMSLWGGPKRRVHGVLIGMALSALLGTVVLGIGRTPTIWAVAAFTTFLTIPIMNGSNQAIWQSKVPPTLQGRVFATRRLIAQITFPTALLIAGPLADRLFEPAMQPDGTLTPLFSWLVGTGTGAGMGLLIVITGILSVVAAISCYAFPAVRNIEDILPDFDANVIDHSLTTDAPNP